MVENKFELLASLNEEQLAPCLDTEGYILVVAGAGTGKTRTLTYRFAFLIKELGVSADNILCLTFTNKATEEMRRRVQTILKSKENYNNISTIHSFCARFLRDNVFALRLPRTFQILDETDTKQLIKKVRKDTADKEVAKASIGEIKRKIERFKYEHTDEYITYLSTKEKTELSEENEVVKNFLEYQRQNICYTFDDLLFMTLYILKTNSRVREDYQNKFQYILVDEFQDTSFIQYQIVSILSEKHKNLFVVGDPDQTIYGFINSDISLILQFNTKFEKVKTYYLNTNYRSNQQILDAANTLISYNKSRFNKNLVANNKEQCHKPEVFTCKNDDVMNLKVVNLINDLKDNNYSYEDIAIIYRNNNASVKLETYLAKNNIPYQILNGISFFQRKEIKILLSYLKLAYFERDDISFEYIRKNMPVGIGDVTFKKIEELAKINQTSCFEILSQLVTNPEYNAIKLRKLDINKKFVDLIFEIRKLIANNTPVNKIMEYIYVESGYQDELRDLNDEDRIANVNDFMSDLTEKVNNSSDDENFSIEKMLQDISLINNASNDKTYKNKVKLVTAHSSKGLEFSNVIIYDFDRFNFPSVYANSPEELEGERRLAFVAITRAKSNLFFVYKDKNDYFGNDISCLSPFGFEMYEKLDFTPNIPKQYIYIERKPSNNNGEPTTFKVGDRVVNNVLGEGTVLKVKKDNFFEVIFDNIQTMRTISGGNLELLTVNESENNDSDKDKYVDFDPYLDFSFNDGGHLDE